MVLKQSLDSEQIFQCVIQPLSVEFVCLYARVFILEA